MGHATVTSREFAHNVSAAKRLADAGPVFITDRGKPAYAFLNIEDYRRMSRTTESIVDLLTLPEAADIKFEFEPVRISARELESIRPSPCAPPRYAGQARRTTGTH